MVPLSFCTLLMVFLNFFNYQWYPRVIEDLTIIIFFDFFTKINVKGTLWVKFELDLRLKVRTQTKTPMLSSYIQNLIQILRV